MQMYIMGTSLIKKSSVILAEYQIKYSKMIRFDFLRFNRFNLYKSNFYFFLLKIIEMYLSAKKRV